MNISFVNGLKSNNFINTARQQKCKFEIGQKDSFELSFKGLHKKEFSGLDLMIVELFKAPIEKFASKDDFNSWAEGKIDDILAHNYTARTLEATAQRKAIIDD